MVFLHGDFCAKQVQTGIFQLGIFQLLIILLVTSTPFQSFIEIFITYGGVSIWIPICCCISAALLNTHVLLRCVSLVQHPSELGSAVTPPYCWSCSVGAGLISSSTFHRRDKCDLSFGARAGTAAQIGHRVSSERPVV